MKNFFIVLLIISLFSCDSHMVNYDSNIQLDYRKIVEISDALDYVPEAYNTGSLVRFKDKNGNITSFTIDKDLLENKETANGEKYLTREYSYNLYSSELDVILSLLTNFGNSELYFGKTETLIVLNSGDLFLGFSKINLFFQSNEFVGIDNEDYKFSEQIVLNGNTFNNVYESIVTLNYDNCSKVYYNVELGIVAFQDRNNKLWTYDSIE